MRVYVDQVFVLNGAIDCMLLACAARLGGLPLLRRRVLAAGAFGGVYAVLVLLPGLQALGALPGRAVCLALMCAAAFGLRRRAVRAAGLFLGCALCFAGVCLAAAQLLGRGLYLLPGGAWYPVSFPALLLLAAAGLLICTLRLPGLLRHRSGEIERLEVQTQKARLTLHALVDTGNTLTDPATNEPVTVAGPETALALFPELRISARRLSDAAGLLAALREYDASLRPRLIPYRAVGTSGSLLLAVRVQARREKRPPGPMLLAFSPTPITDGQEYDALIGVEQ